MSESEKDLDKFLYGGDFVNQEKPTEEAEEVELEEEEEEEDDYEIILDSSKLPTTVTNDLNKRSLTSVSIGEGKEGEVTNSTGTGGDSGAANSGAAPVQVSHFDPFAPGNLNGLQIFDHDLDSFEDKPWRKPGADLTDYFNFGFSEITWRAYCVKQKALREEFGLQKKIGVYDSATVGSGSGNTRQSNNSTSSLNSHGGHNQQQQQQQQQSNRAPRDTTRSRTSHAEGSRGYRGDQDLGHGNRPIRTYSQDLHSHDRRSHGRSRTPSPPPPPPSRHRSRSRSRSPEPSTRRVVSQHRSSSRYDDSSRSPPSKRRRD